MIRRNKRRIDEILKTCDKYFNNDRESYLVEKTDFINLVKVMIEVGGREDTHRGKRIWEKLKP